MTEEKFLRKIKNIICARKKLEMDDRLDDGEVCIWDSLSAVAFLDFVEEETGVYYEMAEEMKTAETVRDLWEFYLANAEGSVDGE